jgi:hypothetical protein
MTGGRSVIDGCASLFWCFVKRIGIEGDAAAKVLPDQHIILLNQDDAAALASRQEA